jgi:hypothetical protein
VTIPFIVSTKEIFYVKCNPNTLQGSSFKKVLRKKITLNPTTFFKKRSYIFARQKKQGKEGGSILLHKVFQLCSGSAQLATIDAW